MKRRLLSRIAWILVAAIVLVLLFKTFVGDVYHVTSASMEPTIWGSEGDGEWVFVRFDRSLPDRNEVVVIRRPEDDAPIVKRVLGKKGESLSIAQGDVLIDRQRRRPSEPRAPAVVVFDDRWQRLEERFDLGPAQARVWHREGSEWRLDARAIDDADRAGVIETGAPLLDDYLGPDHEVVRGRVPANDARIACEVRFDEASGTVRLGLTEQADTFEVLLVRVDDKTAELRLTRSRGGAEREELRTARFPLSTGTWTPFWLENRDNALKVGFGGPTSPLVCQYTENTPESPQLPEARTPPPPTGARAWIGGHDGRFAFRSVRLVRDLVYTDRGRVGVDGEVQLGPDEYFLLGDNSSQSRDSREWGPIGSAEIVGRAVSVVWPPSRWRRIDGSAP